MRTIAVVFLCLLGAASLARADYQIGVVNFTATAPVEIYGVGLSDMLVTDLVKLADQGSKFGTCSAKIVELKRRADILKELELQKSPLVDPSTRAQPGKLLDATYVIEGSVEGSGADSIAWAIQMREVASGRIVARDNASAKIDQLAEATPNIAERMLGQICGKSYKITGKAGPMTVTGTVCNLTKPFTAKGEGGMMLVTFTFNPTNETSGTMSYTGVGTGAAAGVKMAGKGTYSVELDDKGGTITRTTTGAVTNPGGGSATHTDTLTLTRMDPC